MIIDVQFCTGVDVVLVCVGESLIEVVLLWCLCLTLWCIWSEVLINGNSVIVPVYVVGLVLV